MHAWLWKLRGFPPVSYPVRRDYDAWGCRSTSSSARSAGCGSRSCWPPMATLLARRAERSGSAGSSRPSRRRDGSPAAPPSAPTNRGVASAKRRGRIAWARRRSDGRRGRSRERDGGGAEAAAGPAVRGSQTLREVPPARDPDQTGLRRRQRRCRPDVRRRGARGRRGSAGPALRRPCRPAAEPDAGGDRACPRRRLHRQRPQVPPARQPRPAAVGDPGLRALPAGAGAADRAAGRLHPRQLRDEAAQRQPDRDHQGARDAAGAHPRRAHRLPAAALPPGGGAADAGGDGDPASRFRDDPEAAATASAGADPQLRGTGGAGGRGRLDPTASQRPARLLRLGAAGFMEVLVTNGAAETEALGARIAERLQPGDVVLLSGELGTGKTTLVRGACRALGVPGPVTSPTFTIGQRYSGGRLSVSHLDLYRLQTLEGEDPALLEDYLRPEGVAFVEWPAAGSGHLGRPALEVRLAHLDEERRRVEIEW